MSAITASNLMINGVSAQTLSANAATQREQAKQAGEALGPLSISSDSMKVSAGSQGFAVPAVVLLLVDEQRIEGVALRFGEFFQGNGQGQVGRAEAHADQICDGFLL